MTTTSLLLALLTLSVAASASGAQPFGPSCLAVNSTVCNGFNAGACRMDCNPAPQATESECKAKGCCWQETYDKTGNPSQVLPWCFFPGGSPQCMIGQVAKDTDPAVKSAAVAYHRDGTGASVEAYRSACLARGDWFYSFFVTPMFWQNDQYVWISSKVTLVKYGCNSKACTDSDIKHVVHRIEAPQNEINYYSGTHASLKFNVTGYSAQKAPFITDNGTNETGDGSSNAALLVVITLIGILLIAVTAAAFHYYRKFQVQHAQNEAAANCYYNRKDSFPIHVHASLDEKTPAPPPLVEEKPGDDARKSLVDSEILP